MAGLVSLGLALLLSFSFRIVEKLSTLIRNGDNKQFFQLAAIYIWGACAIAAALVVSDQYVFRVPTVDTTAFALAAAAILINAVIPQHSGYHPSGKFNIINFVVTYPIVEEIIYRGLLLPILDRSFHYTVVEIYDLPVTLSIVITALLFAVAHLQYYKLNRTSIKYMVFAFTGGIIFGVITNATHSILIPVLLHVEYNLLAVYYSNKMKAE
ncbi:CPBP family intramembrane glutamic endopeptidase [Paenibacillus kobensis]|uniref:CPBP family intramembrane glutamic endopeptidase n=1 Tax=Paenibacillus kobensis TaxID=59841 RepID=UPI000FDB1A06|nr:CPBP family intramembrane glutamic endopeptidase [Paenibacillus kobensis]